MNQTRKLISSLKQKERNAIITVMAFMSYNPSIGRALEKYGVEKFQSMVIKKVTTLSRITSIEQFDRFHRSWVNQFVRHICNNKRRKCSIGQAQKAINVFLKLYVDWARLPDRITARKILPFLHVPLDSILMSKVAEYFPKFFEEEIRSIRKNNYNHSLARIDRKEYDAWQKFFRDSHPQKPIIFDIIWATNR